MLLILSYLWAGATTVFALWLFEQIGETMNRLLPEEKRAKTHLTGSPGTMALLLLLWPLILPTWALIAWREGRKQVGEGEEYER